jgi:hypothetical protein
VRTASAQFGVASPLVEFALLQARLARTRVEAASTKVIAGAAQVETASAQG